MRERIIELARRPEFIPHVYDYCDRWCRFCPATGRCLVYRFERSRDSELAATSFWTIDDEIEEGMELASAICEATGTPVAELDLLLSDPSKAPRAPALGDPLELLARHYAIQSGSFLQSFGQESWEEPDGPPPSPLAVVACYHVMIAAKTYRALVSTDLSTHGSPALRDDARGSAKVVLIGIERSIDALREIAAKDDGARIGALIELLEALLPAVERRFPDARQFVRPGLDSPSKTTEPS